MGVTFMSQVDISTDAGTWTDKDLSASVPVGTLGVIVYVHNPTGANRPFGIRKNGSTDARTGLLLNTCNAVFVIGVDSSRIIELYGEGYGIKAYLIGYIDSGAVFNTNATDVSLSGTGAWTDIDINVNDGAIGAIIEVHSTTYYDYGIRKNGSTDARTSSTRGHSSGMFVVGLDASEIFEGYIANANVDFFVVGYFNDSNVVEFYINGTDVSLSSIGSFIDLTAITGSKGIIVESNWINAVNYANLRKNGVTSAPYNLSNSIQHHCCSIVESDTNGVIEGYIGSTDVDFYFLGYFKSPPTIVFPIFSSIGIHVPIGGLIK
jgi:hypothetical protein